MPDIILGYCHRKAQNNKLSQNKSVTLSVTQQEFQAHRKAANTASHAGKIEVFCQLMLKSPRHSIAILAH